MTKTKSKKEFLTKECRKNIKYEELMECAHKEFDKSFRKKRLNTSRAIRRKTERNILYH